MSIYSCIDLIDEQLKRMQDRSFPLWEEDYLPPHPSIETDRKLLEDLRKRLQKYLNHQYDDLLKEIQFIQDQINTPKHGSISYTLRIIKTDLESIYTKNMRSKGINYHFNKAPILTLSAAKKKKRSPLTAEKYRAFQSHEYRIAPINQGALDRLGNSRGECLGFVYSMADPDLSPYKKAGIEINLNQEVYNYQKHQLDRNKDQDKIKRSRLTREYFSPNKKKQAHKILKYASKYKGQDLLLIRKASIGLHACYISVQQDDDYIRYMDPNHGAYLFKKPNDFIDFYVAAAEYDKEEYDCDFRFYYLSKLRVDENKTLKESKTWSGIIRSLLTGAKYSDNQNNSFFFTTLFYLILGGAVGGGIGALFGSIVPIAGTIIGAFIGATLGLYIGLMLPTIAANKSHLGLLGIPHLILDTLQNVKESLEEYFYPSPQKDKADKLKPTEAPEISSTQTILSNCTIPSDSCRLRRDEPISIHTSLFYSTKQVNNRSEVASEENPAKKIT